MRGGSAGRSFAQGSTISCVLGSQRERWAGGALAVRAHGSTAKDTTGGDHLANGSGGRASASAAGADAGETGAATALIGGKPDAGIGRTLTSGVLAGRGRFVHGSVMSPCCARATPPTSSEATRTLIVDRCRTAILSIAQAGHSGQYSNAMLLSAGAPPVKRIRRGGPPTQS